jgi:hypothetical protein
MSRRFWAAVMIVSLLTAAGGAAFLYKTLLDKSTVETSLNPVPTAKLRPELIGPEPHQAPPKADEASNVVLRNIQFVYINSTAKDVFIVGNFDNKGKTSKKPMEKERNKWTVNLKLAPGNYEYSYLVNGRSVRDPYNKKTSNGKSLITVKPLPAN